MANLQAATANQREPPVRPESEKGVLDASNVGEVERPLSAWERLTNITALRSIFILVMIAVFWEAYARFLDKTMMLPTSVDTATTFWDELMRPLTFDSACSLPVQAWTSVAVILQGYALGVDIAAVCSSTAVQTGDRTGTRYNS